MLIERKSPLTGETNVMDLPVTEEQMAELEGPRSERRLIQDIFPNLDRAQREFLLTGYTQEDWDKMFADGEEEEYDDDSNDGEEEDEDGSLDE
jgi:hypothetical protein